MIVFLDWGLQICFFVSCRISVLWNMLLWVEKCLDWVKSAWRSLEQLNRRRQHHPNWWSPCWCLRLSLFVQQGTVGFKYVDYRYLVLKELGHEKSEQSFIRKFWSRRLFQIRIQQIITDLFRPKSSGSCQLVNHNTGSQAWEKNWNRILTWIHTAWFILAWFCKLSWFVLK